MVALVKKYGFLIRQLVIRDFKVRYKRSVLGVLWSLLNPVLTMSVQYMVFSRLFRFDIPYYAVYLLCGIVLFSYFTDACLMALLSIVDNAHLITKVYVPKYIYPLTRIISTTIHLVLSLVPLLLLVLLSGLPVTPAYLLLPYVLLCLIVFSLGMGMLLASAMVFFRDTQFLWGVISMIWMYATPIFYPVSILPEWMLGVIRFNPLHAFINFARVVVISGVSPAPSSYISCFVAAAVTFAAGAAVFKRLQDRFIFYL